MNKPILAIGLAAIALMCLWPPWKAYESGEATPQAIEYRGFMEPHEWTESGTTYRGEVDTGRLLVQVHVVAIAAAALAYLVGPQPRRREWEEKEDEVPAGEV